MALGAAAAFGQDACADVDGQAKLDAAFRALLPQKGVEQSIDDRKAAISTGKQFLEKYGACPAAKEFSDYLTVTIPKLEKRLKEVQEKAKKDALVARFDTALKGSNWDDVYATGKELLNGWPDEYRVIEVVLGSIGLDETAKTPRVTKWNDDTLKYAKMSLQDLDAGKITTFGVRQFSYDNKLNAIGWMNYTIGFILTFDKNNKKDGAAYLYKASQAPGSSTATNWAVYKYIGSIYYEQVNSLIPEVAALAKAQDPKDTDDVKKQKHDAFKAKLGLLNGTIERALDAYSRAYSLALASKPPNKATSDSLYKTLGELYNVRFDKPDGLEAWVKAAPTKPMPDPTTAITPVNDPEPVQTTTTSTTPTTTTPIKPLTSTPKPGGKPQSIVTETARSTGTTATVVNTVVKKKGNR